MTPLNDKLLPYAGELFNLVLGSGWNPKGPGPEYSCKCPFHEDKSPSFSANVRKGLWKCHSGCGGGDLVDLAGRYWRLDPKVDMPRLVEHLESALGIALRESRARRKDSRPPALPPAGEGDAEERIRKWGDPREWTRLVTEASKTPPPTAWLAKRAISPEIAAAARLGTVTANTTPRSWWVPDGSAYTLVVPVWAGETCVGFELRPEKGFPSREGGKPLKSVSTGKAFFRAPTPTGDYGRWVFLCEGPLDALAAASAGVRACSALPGASTWDSEWGHFLWDRWVVVAYDDDTAGVAAGVRVAHALFPYACAVRVVAWDAVRSFHAGRTFGKDVGDLLAALPPEMRRTGLDNLASTAVFNPRELAFRVDEHTRGRLHEALATVGTWPEDHGVRVVRNRYYVEERDKEGGVEMKGPLTDFTFRVVERRFDEEGGLRRLVRVRGPCDVPGAEGWVGDGEWRSVGPARDKVYSMGAFFLREVCTPVQWGRILAREEKRIPMNTVRGLLHLGRLDQGEGGATRYAPPNGPWVFADGVLEGGESIPVSECRATSPTVGSLFIELEDARITPTTGARPMTPGDIFRRAVLPWGESEEREHRWALGWAAACGFIPEWGQVFDGFPLLFLCGEKEAGKTQFGTLLMRLWGIRGKPSSFANSTVKSLIFDAAALSCLPMVRDEYRDAGDGDKELGKKLSWLRGVFDRSSARRGTVKDKSVSRPVRAGLCLMGQHWPERDEAVNSRAIIIEFAKKQWSPDVSHIQWLTRALRTDDVDLAGVGRQLAMGGEATWNRMRIDALKLREELGKWTAGAAGERTLDGAAICGAGWCAVTGDDPLTILHDLVRFCLRRAGDTTATNPVVRFLEWVGAKILEKGPHFDPGKGDHFCIWRGDFDVKTRVPLLRLHVEKAFELYREHLARQRMPLPEEQELRRLFRNMPYCSGHYERFRLHQGKLGRGWVVDLGKGPESLREAVEMAERMGAPADTLPEEGGVRFSDT